MATRILQGSVFDVLPTIERGSIDCCVTSPPYWNLRSYLPKGHPLKPLELGSEKTPAEFISNMVRVFSLVRDCLADHGTLWLNMGDSYSNGVMENNRNGKGSQLQRTAATYPHDGGNKNDSGIDSGNLCLIPQRLAIALQEPEVHHVIKRDVDRAWLAAMIDGEGTISIRRAEGKSASGKPCQDGYTPFICIGNNDKELLDRCVAITGHGSVQLKCRAGSTDSRGIVSRRDNYGWRLESAKAIEVICDVFPFLIAKRKQAILAHTLACHNKSGKSLRGWQKPIPPIEQEKRVLLKKLVNDCNQRQLVDLPDWCIEPSPTIAPGWIVRSVIVWHKPAPMPTSVSGWAWRRCRVKESGGRKLGIEYQHAMGPGGTSLNPASWTDCPGCKKCDRTEGYVLRRGSWRPTSSYEPILMLAKSANYFADGEPVKTPAAEATVSRDKYTRVLDDADEQFAVRHDHETICDSGANLRDVWRIAAEPLKEAHYAAFPTELVRRCLQAGTSAKGYCPSCGKPWARTVEGGVFVGDLNPAVAEKVNRTTQGGKDLADRQADSPTKTIGWRQSCNCITLEPRPARVLDPFCGSGRTGITASRLGLDFIGVELNPAYVEMAQRILRDESPLFADTEATS